MSEDKLEMFAQRYDDHDTPWDTGITPPEIVEIVDQLPPGKALDLGCGTGTTVQYLLEHGWEADGIDFIPQAVNAAKAKLIDFPADQYNIFCHDVTQLDQLEGLRSPYDLVIDIGCGHNIALDEQPEYARDIATLLKPGGVFMWYAHLPREDRQGGLTPDDVRRIYSPHFEIAWQSLSTDTTSGSPAGWYRLVRKS